MTSGVLLFHIGFFLAGGAFHHGADYTVGLVVIILGYAFATIQNDVEDVAIDAINAPDKAVPSGALSMVQAHRANTVILVSLLILSLYHFPFHVVFVLVMLGMTWLYNKKPFVLSRRPIASLIILAFLYSPFPLVYGYHVYGKSLAVVTLAILLGSWFLLRISVAILKDYKDTAGDRTYHKRTFYLVYSARTTAWVSVVLYMLGCLGIFWALVHARDASWLWVLPALLALRMLAVRLNLFATADEKKLTQLFNKVFFGQNQCDAAILLCLILLK